MADLQSIWTEKYRPQTFDEVEGQKHIVQQLRAFVSQKNMPHLMFAGPAGVGKSTLALVIAKQLFGETYQDNFLELNASDERGIDVVRSKVKDFARTRSIGDVPFKIIFLDECDALTKEAQQALRRTMENYSSSTRFVLSCNYSSKIIDPIQSRCTVYKFKPLEIKELYNVIDNLSKNEGLNINEDVKKALYDASLGDVRKVENIMQSLATLSKDFTVDDVYSISNMVNPDILKVVLEKALKNDFVSARNDLLKIMADYGLSGVDVIKQLQKEIFNLDIDNLVKVKLIDKCGDIEFRLNEGSDEFIQLEALLAHIALLNND